MRGIRIHLRCPMQIVFLIWPVLLLPVLLAWLTRPGQSANRLTTPRPAPRSAASTTITVPAEKLASHSHVLSKKTQNTSLEMLELAVIQRRRESPAYRLAAHTAYMEMQQMCDESEAPCLPSSPAPHMPLPPREVGTHGLSNSHQHPLARPSGIQKSSLR